MDSACVIKAGADLTVQKESALMTVPSMASVTPRLIDVTVNMDPQEKTAQ